MLEHQHANRNLRRRPASSRTAALGKPPSHRFEHGVDELVVIEQSVDAPQLWLHELS
jgi:hypothetical protein